MAYPGQPPMGIPGMPPMPYMVGAPPPILGGVMTMPHVSLKICLDSDFCTLIRNEVVVGWFEWLVVRRMRVGEVGCGLRELARGFM